MNPRIAVSAVSTWRNTFDEDLKLWDSAGITHVGLSMRKLREAGMETALDRIGDAGLRVSTVGEIGWLSPARREKWERGRTRLLDAIDVASRVNATAAILVSGPAEELTSDQAADALEEALAPVVARATQAGVALALENTHPSRPDYSFVHSLGDAARLARRFGIRQCMEVNSCWEDPKLEEGIAASDIALVQLSDAMAGSTTYPDRVPLGDGDIPLPGIINALESSGYKGAYEIELMGPRIEPPVYADAVGRSVDYLENLLAG
jgi:sugar phosphate isomerase/epimerase